MRFDLKIGNSYKFNLTQYHDRVKNQKKNQDVKEQFGSVIATDQLDSPGHHFARPPSLRQAAKRGLKKRKNS